MWHYFEPHSVVTFNSCGMIHIFPLLPSPVDIITIEGTVYVLPNNCLPALNCIVTAFKINYYLWQDFDIIKERQEKVWT